MTKPWEKTYAVHPEDARCILSTSGPDEGKVVADLRLHVSEAREVGEMFAAAPDMARALMEHVAFCESCKGTGRIRINAPGGSAPADCPSCADDRAAIKKAGILP